MGTSRRTEEPVKIIVLRRISGAIDGCGGGFALEACSEHGAGIGRTVVVVDACKVGREGIGRPIAYGGARRVGRYLEGRDERGKEAQQYREYKRDHRVPWSSEREAKDIWMVRKMKERRSRDVRTGVGVVVCQSMTCMGVESLVC